MNYAELTQRIQEYTENYEPTFVADIPTFIMNAEKRIFQEAKPTVATELVTFSLVPGTELQPLPPNFLAPDSLRIDDAPGGRLYCDLKEYQYIDSAFGWDPPGTPRVYAMREIDRLLVAPVPLAAYTATMIYFAYPESIVTAGTTWLGDNFDMLLLYGALVEAYSFMKGEADMVAIYQAQYAKDLLLLKKYVAGPLSVDAYKSASTKV
jgi:hypothetical protein